METNKTVKSPISRIQYNKLFYDTSISVKYMFGIQPNRPFEFRYA